MVQQVAVLEVQDSLVALEVQATFPVAGAVEKPMHWIASSLVGGVLTEAAEPRNTAVEAASLAAVPPSESPLAVPCKIPSVETAR